jgi:hypothetical protein
MSLIIINLPKVVASAGTIVSCVNAKPPGPSMRWSYEQQGGWWIGARRYKLCLLITTSSPLVGPIAIQNYLAGIAAIQGSTYQFPLPELNSPNLPGPITETDTGSFLQDVNIDQAADDQSGRLWLVTLNYGPFDINHELGTSQQQNGSNNPIESAPQVKWSGAKYEVSYPQDVNGQPFLNTVGDPLENPPKREESRQQLSYIANSPTYDDNWAQAYRDAVNGDVFLGFAPNQVKCKNIEGDRQYTADYGYYWRVSFEFEFRVQTFTDSSGNQTIYGFEDLVLNAGLRQLNTNGALTQIIVNGIPVTNPVPLTKAGLPLNFTWSQNNNPNPYFLVFMQYRQQTFANLNINQAILTQNQ